MFRGHLKLVLLKVLSMEPSSGYSLMKKLEKMLGARPSPGSDLFQAGVSGGFMLGMLAFAFVLGSAAGTLPAIQASRLAPVDALRHE